MNKAQLKEKIAEITAQVEEHKTARERIVANVPEGLCKRWIISVVENRINDLRDRREQLNQAVVDIERSDIGRVFIDGKPIN